MSKEAITRLTEDIDNRIDYYRQEYELSYAEVIGVLTILQLVLYDEAKEEDGKDEFEEES